MHVNTCSLHAYAHNINTLCSHFGWSVHSCWCITSQCSVLLTAENRCFWMLHVGIGTCWLNCGSQCKLCMLCGVDLLLAEMSICFLIWHPKRAPNWSFWHPQSQKVPLNTGIECEFYSEIPFKHNWNSVNDKHVIAFYFTFSRFVYVLKGSIHHPSYIMSSVYGLHTKCVPCSLV